MVNAQSIEMHRYVMIAILFGKAVGDQKLSMF